MFFFLFCLMIEGSWSRSVTPTNVYGSGRPKNIRIRNTDKNNCLIYNRWALEWALFPNCPFQSFGPVSKLATYSQNKLLCYKQITRSLCEGIQRNYSLLIVLECKSRSRYGLGRNPIKQITRSLCEGVQRNRYLLIVSEIKSRSRYGLGLNPNKKHEDWMWIAVLKKNCVVTSLIDLGNLVLEPEGAVGRDVRK
jgi:hypothetical protein